jgi:hypothetical protein
MMRPLIRSTFLLSLAVSPLALAGAPAPTVDTANTVVTATASGSTSSEIDEAGLRTKVDELEVAVADIRREMAEVRTQDDATEVVGAVNDHPLWP